MVKTVTAGSYLAVYAGTGVNTTALTAISDTSSRTWTLKQSVVVSGYSTAYVWTSNPVASTGSITVTVTAANTGETWGADLLEFGGSAGIGASSKTNVLSGAPTLNLTSTGDNSAVIVVNLDATNTDGASRAWLTNAGAFSELSYSRAAGVIAAYGGYHADAGAIGTDAVGLSAPAAQKYSIIACEVLGTATAAGKSPGNVSQYGSFI
jgi:hypothetical protein